MVVQAEVVQEVSVVGTVGSDSDAEIVHVPVPVIGVDVDVVGDLKEADEDASSRRGSLERKGARKKAADYVQM